MLATHWGMRERRSATVQHLLQYKLFVMVPWCLMRPPPLHFEGTPLRTEPLPEPPHGVISNPVPAPDRVGPSHPPVSFVDGNGYIVLRGLLEARDFEVWAKVMKAWGSGDEKVVAKMRGVKIRQGIPISRGVGKAKPRWGTRWGASFQEGPHPPHGKRPSGWQPQPNDAG